ncbi:MAG TPA: HD domain-containing protein [bacterium]|nr:HD domain-containing protein [bacterium]
MLRQAFLLAVKGHKYQLYGDDPYLVHLYDVVSVLVEFGFTDETFLAAAWLHDIIEDTSYNYHDVVNTTSKEVAEIVFAVTDEIGRNRKERTQKSVSKTFGFHNALVIKLADWIANLRNCVYKNPQLLQMYQKDLPYLRQCKSVSTGLMDLEPLWEEVERLVEK